MSKDPTHDNRASYPPDSDAESGAETEDGWDSGPEDNRHDNYQRMYQNYLGKLERQTLQRGEPEVSSPTQQPHHRQYAPPKATTSDAAPPVEIPTWEVHTRSPNRLSNSRQHPLHSPKLCSNLGVRHLGSISTASVDQMELDYDKRVADLQESDQPATYVNYKKKKALREREVVLQKKAAEAEQSKRKTTARPPPHPPTQDILLGIPRHLRQRQAEIALQIRARTIEETPSLQEVADHCRLPSVWALRLALLAIAEQWHGSVLRLLYQIKFDWTVPPGREGDPPRRNAENPSTTFLTRPYSAPRNPTKPAPEPIRDPEIPFRFRDGTLSGPASEVIERDTDIQDFHHGYLQMYHRKLAPAWDKKGKDQRRRLKDHYALFQVEPSIIIDRHLLAHLIHPSSHRFTKNTALPYSPGSTIPQSATLPLGFYRFRGGSPAFDCRHASSIAAGGLGLEPAEPTMAGRSSGIPEPENPLRDEIRSPV